MEMTTTTLEEFRRTPVSERCFFADGGLGIKVYDYDHGLTETHRVREDESITSARVPFVPLLQGATDRYRQTLAEAFRLRDEAGGQRGAHGASSVLLRRTPAR